MLLSQQSVRQTTAATGQNQHYVYNVVSRSPSLPPSFPPSLSLTLSFSVYRTGQINSCVCLEFLQKSAISTTEQIALMRAYKWLARIEAAKRV